MGQSRATRAEGAADLIITGALVLDHWGVVKADVGVRDGRIVGLGKAGNPDTMHRRAAAVSAHAPLYTPRRPPGGVGWGSTTRSAGGAGPAEGTKATTVTPGAW